MPTSPHRVAVHCTGIWQGVSIGTPPHYWGRWAAGLLTCTTALQRAVSRGDHHVHQCSATGNAQCVSLKIVPQYKRQWAWGLLHLPTTVNIVTVAGKITKVDYPMHYPLRCSCVLKEAQWPLPRVAKAYTSSR